VNARATAVARPTLLVAAVAALALSLLWVMSPALATHVVPTPINEGNPTCDDFAPEGEDWTQFKLQGDDLADGTYTDGTLEVTIDNFVNSNSGTPGSFDWSSNIGVDAVFVKAGTDKHNLYLYDPEETSDTGLGPQAGQGNGISHISFCYDEDEESAPPSAEESVSESVSESVAESVPASAEQSVEAGTGTPAASNPDTAGIFGGSNPLPTIAFSLILLASLAGLAFANVKGARSRS